MTQTRKKHNPGFKARVALPAIHGDLSIAELASRFPSSSQQDKRLEEAPTEGAPALFEAGQGQKEKANEAIIPQLYQQIGQLKVERDFLSRRSGL